MCFWTCLYLLGVGFGVWRSVCLRGLWWMWGFFFVVAFSLLLYVVCFVLLVMCGCFLALCLLMSML